MTSQIDDHKLKEKSIVSSYIKLTTAYCYHFLKNLLHLQIKPPQDLDKNVEVVGLEETDQAATIILEVFYGRVNERLIIDRFYISEVFNYDVPMTRRQILNYIPFTADVHITGQTITLMKDIRVRASAMQVPQTRCHQIPPTAAQSRAPSPQFDELENSQSSMNTEYYENSQDTEQEMDDSESDYNLNRLYSEENGNGQNEDENDNISLSQNVPNPNSQTDNQ